MAVLSVMASVETGTLNRRPPEGLPRQKVRKIAYLIAGDDDRVAAVAVGVAGAGGGRVVAAPALEPAQEPAQCAGRRAAVAAAPGANPARSGGLAGQRGKNQGVRTPTDPYVTAERASVRQKTEPTTRESSSRTPATGGGFGLYAQRRNTRLFREITV